MFISQQVKGPAIDAAIDGVLWEAHGLQFLMPNEKRLSDAAPKLVKRGDAGGGR